MSGERTVDQRSNDAYDHFRELMRNYDITRPVQGRTGQEVAVVGPGPSSNTGTTVQGEAYKQDALVSPEQLHEEVSALLRFGKSQEEVVEHVVRRTRQVEQVQNLARSLAQYVGQSVDPRQVELFYHNYQTNRQEAISLSQEDSTIEQIRTRLQWKKMDIPYGDVYQMARQGFEAAMAEVMAMTPEQYSKRSNLVNMLLELHGGTDSWKIVLQLLNTSRYTYWSKDDQLAQGLKGMSDWVVFERDDPEKGPFMFSSHVLPALAQYFGDRQVEKEARAAQIGVASLILWLCNEKPGKVNRREIGGLRGLMIGAIQDLANAIDSKTTRTDGREENIDHADQSMVVAVADALAQLIAGNDSLIPIHQSSKHFGHIKRIKLRGKSAKGGEGEVSEQYKLMYQDPLVRLFIFAAAIQSFTAAAVIPLSHRMKARSVDTVDTEGRVRVDRMDILLRRHRSDQEIAENARKQGIEYATALRKELADNTGNVKGIVRIANNNNNAIKRRMRGKMDSRVSAALAAEAAADVAQMGVLAEMYVQQYDEAVHLMEAVLFNGFVIRDAMMRARLQGLAYKRKVKELIDQNAGAEAYRGLIAMQRTNSYLDESIAVARDKFADVRIQAGVTNDGIYTNAEPAQAQESGQSPRQLEDQKAAKPKKRGFLGFLRR